MYFYSTYAIDIETSDSAPMTIAVFPIRKISEKYKVVLQEN